MKIIGIIIILIACTAMGYIIDSWQKSRVDELEDLIYAFEILKGEIDYRLTPIIEACQRVSEMTSPKISRVFECFKRYLEERELLDTKAMWKEALKVNEDHLHLTFEDYKVLNEFGGVVGYLDKEMQKRNVELLINKLIKIKDEAKEKYQRTSKMYRGIGILVGACISIVLI